MSYTSPAPSLLSWSPLPSPHGDTECAKMIFYLHGRSHLARSVGGCHPSVLSACTVTHFYHTVPYCHRPICPCPCSVCAAVAVTMTDLPLIRCAHLAAVSLSSRQPINSTPYQSCQPCSHALSPCTTPRRHPRRSQAGCSVFKSYMRCRSHMEALSVIATVRQVTTMMEELVVMM